MRTRASLTLLVALTIALTTACASAEEEAATVEVSAAFEAYKAALEARDGAAAAAQLTPASIALYEKFRDLALHDHPEAAAQHAIVDRLIAVMIKRTIPADELKELDGRAVFERAIALEVVGKDFYRFKVTGVSLETPTRARAKLEIDDQHVPFRLRFEKLDGAWRLDLSSLFGPIDGTVTALVGQVDDDAATWILKTAKRAIEKPPTP